MTCWFGWMNNERDCVSPGKFHGAHTPTRKLRAFLAKASRMSFGSFGEFFFERLNEWSKQSEWFMSSFVVKQTSMQITNPATRLQTKSIRCVTTRTSLSTRGENRSRALHVSCGDVKIAREICFLSATWRLLSCLTGTTFHELVHNSKALDPLSDRGQDAISTVD